MSTQTHKHSGSVSQNHKAQLANAYNELGKELSSTKVKVVGNYTLGKVIGEGTYGKVRLGTHRLTSTRVAIKQIPKAMSSELTREIHHHRRLHHPHVAQLYEVIATENSIWLVTELCSGGELFDYLVEKGRMTEDECRTVFGQLCLAVGYIHDKGVVHRDLKLENVLLDERCRVKLGDFGFTREYERGSLLETFCGTTGYASPEMLQGMKYLGPEVDIWSLGIILYCLLTGTLPFDDDDDMRMREKIIIGSYEDPEWLSTDARDLIRNVLQQDPAKRLTISQILAHKWFTRPDRNVSSTSLTSPPIETTPRIPEQSSPIPPSEASTSSATSPSSFHSASSQLSNSAPTTPVDGFQDSLVHLRNTSESTIKKTKQPVNVTPQRDSYRKQYSSGNFEDEDDDIEFPMTPSRDPSPSSRANQTDASPGNSKPPSAFPTRTPARTKRRSVSSVLSVPSSPTVGISGTLAPQDFASLHTTPAPLLFSTPIERTLLNGLSSIGFDTGQMVHSVLSDACDSSGAVWWMLKRKAEKKALEDVLRSADVGAGTRAGKSADNAYDAELERKTSPPSPLMSPQQNGSAIQSQESLAGLAAARSAPELTFIPPTPTIPTSSGNHSVTPPRSKSPQPPLSTTPTPSESATKSTPSTPGSSLREKGKRENKPRSGSVSIMQRATTALEAAGLVRKKSAEAVREEKERKEEKEERERRSMTASDPRGLHNALTNKLTKSPPMRAVKDAVMPSTPEQEITTSNLQASPWVIPATKTSFPEAPTPANSPGDTVSSLPHVGSSGKLSGPGRNRGSILSTFRMWFNEDRKGKRKSSAPITPSNSLNHVHTGHSPTAPAPTRNHRGTVKRRGSGSGGNVKHRAGNRPSASSRRSSSVNSRRSSVASMHMIVLESPLQNVDEMPYISRQRSDPSRRSFTPNSEVDRGDYPSRPSSVHSYSKRTRHKKSPSTSSAGSAAHRAASPLQKYHRRAGSGSSTRVVRQTKPGTGSSSRPWHVRSNSTTSSVHSLHSSRPGSFYEISEGEGQRTGSPLQSSRAHRSTDDTSRRGTSYNTVLVAHKKTTPFMSPSSITYSSSYGRTSWKKAWGTEPPGWQSRPTQLPVEVLAISPGTDQQTCIRDVFSGRQSLNLGDEDDWVDEDEDVTAFIGGLGQTPMSSSSMPLSTLKPLQETPMMLSPAPRGKGNRNTKRDIRNPDNNLTAPPSNGGPRSGGRSKGGHSPVSGSSPLPSENGAFEAPPSQSDSRIGRRQLPAGRSGPAFRLPIQEEDEDEE